MHIIKNQCFELQQISTEMINQNLNKEIEASTKRLENRQSRIDSELEILSTKIENYTYCAWLFVIFGALVAIFSIVFYICKNTESGFGLNLLGDFMAGTVASIWSLAGLFFIYVAFLGQKQQLLNQQLEIMYNQLEVKYTRLELEGQKLEMKEQNQTLRQQRFENTFFQLLTNHQEIVNGIDTRDISDSSISHGRDCFEIFYKQFSFKMDKDTPLDKMLEEYMEFYYSNQADLGHYFRTVYHILKFVKNANEIEPAEKFKYTSLLRALLSSYEISLIFYNGLSKNGKSHFKPLIEEFSFLKNLEKDLIINPNHIGAYDELAYASFEERNELIKSRNTKENDEDIKNEK